MKETFRKFRHTAAHMLMRTEIIRTPSYGRFMSEKFDEFESRKRQYRVLISTYESDTLYKQREAVQIDDINYFIREIEIKQSCLNMTPSDAPGITTNLRTENLVRAENGEDLKLYSRIEAIAALKEWRQQMQRQMTSDPRLREYVHSAPPLRDFFKAKFWHSQISPLPSATPL